MRGEVIFEICLGVTKRYLMLLEQRVKMKACLQLQDPTDLGFGQGTRAIPLNGDRLEGSSRHIVPSALEGGGNILRQLYGDLHGVPSFYRRAASESLDSSINPSEQAGYPVV